MYTEHFNLKILPFENVPDPAFFFDRNDYGRARKRLADSLKAGKGLMVVTGHIGSGKTTLSQMIKSDFSHDINIIWMAEPPRNSIDLFLFIAQELALKPSTSERTFILRDIRNVLLKINSDGGKCLVIIDESHLISDDVINGIRLLNNLEEGPTKLIQILLLGQNELMEKISRPEMEPFKQRIATIEILGKMNAERIREYVTHRIKVAGGTPSIFADSGWEALDLAFRSGATPRIINSLCDRSLNVAFEREKTIVDAHDVFEASQVIGLSKNIFHYVLELKHKDRIEQVPLTRENDSIKEPEIQNEAPIQSFSRESVETTLQPSQKVSKTGLLLSRINQEGLKIPMLLLLLSLATFILSIFFYCQISASEPVTCLYELIGF